MAYLNHISNYNTVLENGCKVICGIHAASGYLLNVCAEIAVRRRLHLFDFGNRCDMYFTARCLRPLTRDPAAAMRNIRLQRAFTCYQALNLLQQMDQLAEDMPVIILDLLSPFLDENIQTSEISRLFRESLMSIRSEMRRRLLLIGVKPVPSKLAPDRVWLLKELADTFGMMNILPENEFHAGRISGQPEQPSLF